MEEKKKKLVLRCCDGCGRDCYGRYCWRCSTYGDPNPYRRKSNEGNDDRDREQITAWWVEQYEQRVHDEHEHKYLTE